MSGLAQGLVDDATQRLADNLSKFSEPVLGHLTAISESANAGFIANFQGALEPLAISICGVIYLIHLVEASLKEHQNGFEMILRDLILFAFYAMIISHCSELYNFLNQIGNVIFNAIKAYIVDIESNASFMKVEADDLASAFGFWLTAFTSSIVFTVLGVVGTMAVFTRNLELLVRAAFLPIGISFLPEGGWQGAGGRYIKRLLACYIQGGVMIGIMAAYAQLLAGSANLSNVDLNGSGFVTMMAGGFAAAGMLQKSGQVANDIMGV